MQEQLAGRTEALHKNIPSPVTPFTMVAPEPGQTAAEYLEILADLERQLADMARLEGRPVTVHWVIPPTDAAPASEDAS